MRLEASGRLLEEVFLGLTPKAESGCGVEREGQQSAGGDRVRRDAHQASMGGVAWGGALPLTAQGSGKAESTFPLAKQ